MRRVLAATLALLLLSTGAYAVGQVAGQAIEQGIEYRSTTGWDAGGAVLATTNGGAYEYSGDAAEHGAADGRPPLRFLMTKPERDEFSLFSAEEEEALWDLRERLRREREAAALAAASSTATPSRRRHPSIVWPRVVVTGEKTCVPRLEFSEGPDWREHLVCWLAGEKRVQ